MSLPVVSWRVTRFPEKSFRHLSLLLPRTKAATTVTTITKMIVIANTSSMDSSQNKRQIFGSTIIPEIDFVKFGKNIQTYHLFRNSLMASSAHRLSQISALVNLFGDYVCGHPWLIGWVSGDITNVPLYGSVS